MTELHLKNNDEDDSWFEEFENLDSGTTVEQFLLSGKECLEQGSIKYREEGDAQSSYAILRISVFYDGLMKLVRNDVLALALSEDQMAQIHEFMYDSPGDSTLFTVAIYLNSLVQSQNSSIESIQNETKKGMGL